MNMSPFREISGLILALAMLSLASPSSAQQKAAPAPQQAPALSQMPAIPAQAAPPMQAPAP
jgi:biopolymer transport protein ExbB